MLTNKNVRLLLSCLIVSACTSACHTEIKQDLPKISSESIQPESASKSESPGSEKSNSESEAVFVETDIELDQRKLSMQARQLLTEHKYKELDKLIDDLVKSKSEHPNGRWRVDLLYAFCSPQSDGQASDKDWQDQIQELKKWSNENKKSANALIALAQAYVSYAWFARGGHYADKVSDEGWRLMDERLKIASEYCSGAEALKTANPYHFYVELLIGKGSGMEKDKYKEIVSAALKQEPRYELVLLEQIDYLRPRWHGEEGEWERNAKEASDSFGGDAGDKRYAQLMWYAQALGELKHLDSNNRIDYPRIKRGFELLLKENPDSLATQSRFCAIAVSAADISEAKVLFGKINGRISKQAWKTQKYFNQCRDWATLN